jgi:hypothetical protein
MGVRIRGFPSENLIFPEVRHETNQHRGFDFIGVQRARSMGSALAV